MSFNENVYLGISAGTIVHSTARTEDLHPVFLAEYKRVLSAWKENRHLERAVEKARPWGRRARADKLRRFERNAALLAVVPSASHAFDLFEETLVEDITQLEDLLNDLAPEGFYFGTHEADYSDYGWWPVPVEEDA